VTGGLRRSLLDRSELHPTDTAATLRALVPVSLRRYHAHPPAAQGNHLSGYLVDLTVGEPNPHRRVQRVRHTMAGHKAAGPFSGPGALPLLADWLPAAFHRLAARLIARATPLLFDTTVTTVPLPDVPLHLDSAVLREIYPLVPIAPNHGVSLAAATYRGTVHLGLLTDPGLHDSDRLAAALTAALAELHHAHTTKAGPNENSPCPIRAADSREDSHA
jgi:diacylglycerol O-acyltransferase